MHRIKFFLLLAVFCGAAIGAEKNPAKQDLIAPSFMDVFDNPAPTAAEKPKTAPPPKTKKSVTLRRKPTIASDTVPKKEPPVVLPPPPKPKPTPTPAPVIVAAPARVVVPPPPVVPDAGSSLTYIDRTTGDELVVHSPNPDANLAKILSRTATLPLDLSRVWTANKNLPVIVQNAVSSSAGGKILATVQENLYSADGLTVLVPKGSQAFGFYKANLKIGESVLQANWYRIITPDKIYIDFGEDAPLADVAGQAGLGGDVDNRYFERYVGALLFSAINYATVKNLPAATNSAESVATQQLSNNFNNITLEALQNGLGLTPIVTIKAGSYAQISPTKDIFFKSYSQNQIKAEEITLGGNAK